MGGCAKRCGRNGDDKEAVGRSCGEGDLGTGVGDEVLALLRARPWFTLWKPRVFRLQALARDSFVHQMKDADRNTKTTSKTLCCPLDDGVAAGEQCQTEAISSGG